MNHVADLDAHALALADAVLAHARATDESGGDEAAISAATVALREAAWKYSLSFMDITDHGNPFGGLETDEAEDEESEIEESATSWVVSVDAHYVLRLEDLYGAAQLARARLKKTGKLACEDLVTPSEVAYALFSVDGWDPYSYDQNVVKVLRQTGACYVPD